MDNKEILQMGLPRITESRFKLDKNFNFNNHIELELKNNFEIKINKDDESIFLCSMNIFINDKEKKGILDLEVDVECVVKITENIEENKNKLEKTAQNILYDFVRPYIWNLSLSAGIKPLIIPVVNF